MGNFKIEIEAIGGHGDFRDVGQGQALPSYGADSDKYGISPDRQARTFVGELAKSNNVVSAKLIHWPDTTPIVDDILLGIREHGDFAERWQGEEMLKYFNHNLMPPGPGREIARLFCHLAYMVVRTVPRTSERLVALRKLLEGMDAALRAAATGGR